MLPKAAALARIFLGSIGEREDEWGDNFAWLSVLSLVVQPSVDGRKNKIGKLDFRSNSHKTIKVITNRTPNHAQVTLFGGKY